MSRPRWVYKNESEAVAARRLAGREKYAPFSSARLPWRVVVEGNIVACFLLEADARGFSKARYGELGYVEPRTKATPYKNRKEA